MRIHDTAQNLPRKIPNNATGASPPTADGWIHEAKFDGWRIQLHKDDDLVRLYTKKLHLPPSSGLR
jgi:ATP-dependent DNA ligase